MLDLNAVAALLSTIDRLHSSFRQLLASLASITIISTISAQEPFDFEAYYLSLLCIDIRLSGLFGLIHRYLSKSARHAWTHLIAESEQHVRRCIKLFAYVEYNPSALLNHQLTTSLAQVVHSGKRFPL